MQLALSRSLTATCPTYPISSLSKLSIEDTVDDLDPGSEHSTPHQNNRWRDEISLTPHQKFSHIYTNNNNNLFIYLLIINYFFTMENNRQYTLFLLEIIH